jgi:hypothetical protein
MWYRSGALGDYICQEFPASEIFAPSLNENGPFSLDLKHRAKQNWFG